MTIRVDPEQNETHALFGFADLDRRRVLEIGCGDGRLTWLYADRVAHVTAIEPFAPALARAERNLPREIASRVTMRQFTFDEFAAASAASTFDVAIFSWSLCCMEPDEQVPALEQVHTLLAPDGVLIDIHPVPSTATVEVHRGGQVVFAEPASTSDGEGELQAEEALAHVVARGVFDAERRAEFDMRVYASCTSELRDFLAEADAHATQATGEKSDADESGLYERVQHIIAADEAETEVAYHERARITRLRPLAHSVAQRPPSRAE